MWTVKLDATSWGSVSDFYSALLGAIGAPDWHGRSMDALVDSLVFGGINTLRPPIEIIVCNVAKLTRVCLDSGFSSGLDCDSSLEWTDSF
jgi:RNAse (barnase) inhibitor barstar